MAPSLSFLNRAVYQVNDSDRNNFGQWVEWAAIEAGNICLRHEAINCFWCRRYWWS